ncbi:MAG TPA: thioredoxin family protein [Thermoanaerobaculia bacterium]|nr:thioredoxin family protein [Thermoanaerobaculia bacterium]
MRRARLFLLLLLAIAAPLVALPAVEEKASLELDSDRTAYAPGEAGRLVALVRIAPGWHVNSHQPTYEYLIPTTVEVSLPAGWEAPKLTYPKGEIARFTFAEEPLSVFQGEVPIVAAFEVPRAQSVGEVPLRVKVTYQACNDTQCLPPVEHEEKAALRIGAAGEAKELGWFARQAAGIATGAASAGGGQAGRGATTAAGATTARSATSAAGAAATESATAQPRTVAGGSTTAAAATASGGRSLLWILGLGLLGGFILNAMPCVLPVLSIKVFALVKHANLTRRAVATAGLATTFGILASFWALAAAAVLARNAGAAVGWGLHFQQPAFVALLAVVVVLFSLNLWGIFEIQLPGRLATAAGGGAREGIAGHFVTGLFATLMATPCSAPFLGTAVGFALGQPALTVFAVFTAVGLGMAAPYLLLAAWPRAARLLPKPGTWMVRLKEVMGFLLAGAAVWLFYVLAQQVSAASLAFVQLGLLLLALVVWLGRGARTNLARTAAITAVLVVAAATVWAAAAAPPARRGALAEPARGLIAWQPFERARAERLAAGGTLVFVDVTADWCVTCKVNERLVLDTPEVAGAFGRNGVIAMRADWTTRDRSIGDFLAAHGRYGIPFYMLYRPGEEPHVFPELITRDLVIGAVEQTRTVAAR